MNLDTIITFLPLLSYISLIIIVKLGKMVNLLIFTAFLLITIVIGLFPIYSIKPLDLEASDLPGFVSNVIALTYIGSLIYGGIGARGGNIERVIVGFVLVLLVCLSSVLI